MTKSHTATTFQQPTQAGVLLALQNALFMDLSHVVMHVGLCNAVARAAAQRDVPLRVVVTDKLARPQIDQSFPIQRGSTDTARVEFDLPFGVYRLAMVAKAGSGCGAVQYFTVINNHNRTLDVSLQDRPTQPVVPTIIMGEAPFAFSYVEPTVMVFPKATACNATVGNPIDADIRMQNDSDAYYASVYPSSALTTQNFVVAVRLKDSHGDYHYVRVPLQIGEPSRWPSIGTFNVDENVIDYVADKPEDTLLCPRLYKTITY